MTVHRRQLRYVIGPDGLPLTVADLPPSNTGRWVIRRKAQLLAAVRGGLLSVEDVYERYQVSVEELLAWQRAMDAHGMDGLRSTPHREDSRQR
jgi:uncharacterized protein DUF1153